MILPRSIALALGLLTISALAGCASIVSGRHADVSIKSYPPDADVEVYDRRGSIVAMARTPAVVTLKRGDGYFRPARYTAKIEKEGFAPSEVPIEAGVNPWVLGNVVFGGIAGLVVDPFTGAAWRLKPRHIQPDLVPLGGPALAAAPDEASAGGADSKAVRQAAHFPEPNLPLFR